MINRIKLNILGYDWMLIVAPILLAFLGLISLRSTTFPKYIQFYKQIVWIILGLFFFYIFSKIDYKLFKVHFSPVLLLYVLGVFALIVVYILGSNVRGAKSWISLGPINIEPVEPLKLILVFILAKYFSMRHVEMYRIKHIIISGLYILLPAFLVFLQPDLGSLSILLAIWIGIMLVAGIKVKHLAALGIAGLLISFFAWSFLFADYQKDRIISFVNPQEDPYGAGYNSIQAVVAVGSGGLWGQGLGQGTQSQFGFLPEAHTDFIYGSIAEELGLVVALVLIALYALLFWRISKILYNSSDNFARLTAVGISIMISFQIFFNIGMTLGLLPVTGLPLPFVSYGGSSIVTLFVALGVIESIHRNSIHSRKLLDEIDFE